VAIEALGRGQMAIECYRRCVKAYEDLGPQNRPSRAAEAAQCELGIRESEFKAFAEIRLRGSGQAQAKTLRSMLQMKDRLERAYAELLRFDVPEISVAAWYRIGILQERVVEVLYAAEAPPELRDVADYYTPGLDALANTLVDQAIRAYKRALGEAVRMHVANEWSELTISALARLLPAEFPTPRKHRILIEWIVVESHGMDAT
jgi:hypothetical protein